MMAEVSAASQSAAAASMSSCIRALYTYKRAAHTVALHRPYDAIEDMFYVSKKTEISLTSAFDGFQPRGRTFVIS